MITLILSCNQKDKSTLFTKLSEGKTNITFNNSLTDSPEFNVLKYGYFYNGGGVASADFNNDGWTDLLFTGNLQDNKLYFNKGNGDIAFDDVTEKSGLNKVFGWNTGASVVDINSDGWMDIYVCRSGAENNELRRNQLFINNKNGTFEEKAAEYGLNDDGYSTQAVFFDYDKDGDLDCYILNHSVQKYAGFNSNLGSLKATKDKQYASKLMQNNGGKFTDVSDQAGMISNVLSFGLGVMASDYNNDGWTDLYISNDYNEEDYLYINEKNGTFAEVIRQATDHTSLFSMGSDAADINNDGLMDLITLDMLPEGNERIKMTSGDDNYKKYLNLIQSGFHQQFMRNMLQVNSGLSQNTTKSGNHIPLFKEVGQIAGISNTDWSWAALFADYDLDGNKDLFITNGYEKDYTNMDFLAYTADLQSKITNGQSKLDESQVIAKMPSIKEHNYIYQNKGNLQFTDKIKEWGMDEATVSAGAVYADFDNDGDYDIAINNINQVASVYQNNASTKDKSASLVVQLISPSPSLMIGAKVIAKHGTTQEVQEYMPVRGFQSSMAGPMIFAQTTTIDTIIVQWTDGRVQKIVPTENKLTIKYDPSATISNPSLLQKSVTIHSYPEANNAFTFNDFDLQPLLPWMVSSALPKLVANKDGSQILHVGNKLQLFTKKGNSYLSKEISTFNTKYIQDAVWSDMDGDKDEDIVLSIGGYQYSDKGSTIQILRNNKNTYTLESSTYTVPSSQILAMDVDQDGDQDLIVGGSYQKGKFPLAHLSSILVNDGKGHFTSSKQADLGYISDMTLIGNELIMARPFNTIISIAMGKDMDLTKHKPISETGIWKSIAQVKGQLIAGNIGLNHQYSKVSPSGLGLYSGQVYGSTQYIPFLTVNEEGKSFPFAARDELISHIPNIKKKFNDYATYAKASIEDILGDQKRLTKQHEAKEYKSLVINNQGDKKSNLALPYQAQSSCINTITYFDVNNDQIMDIIIGGNDINTRVRCGQICGSHVEVYLGAKDQTYHFYKTLALLGQVQSLAVTNDGELFIGRQNQPLTSININKL